MQWFLDLTIGRKLSMICVTFSFPIAVLLYNVISGINYSINFAQWEVYGDTYQRPLERLLKTVAEHNFLARQNVSSPSDAVSKQMSAKQTEIDEALTSLKAADKAHGVALQFTEEGLVKRNRLHFRVGTLMQEWGELKAAAKTLNVQAIDEKHAHLAADLRMMITHAGDISNLILDPDLDSYYMMDVTLLALPQTQDRLTNIVLYGGDTLQKTELTTAERTQLAVHSAMLKEADLARIVGSSQTALTEDVNFYGSSPSLQTDLAPALKTYSAKTEAFISIIDKVVNSPTAVVTPAEFMQAGMAARDAAFTYWNIAVDEEDKLLKNRIGVFEKDKQQTLAMTGAALIVSLLLALAITKSITNPLHACVESLKAQAAMNFTRKLGLNRKDEIGEMAAGMDTVVDNLREAIQRIVVTSGSLSEAAMMWATVTYEMSETAEEGSDIKEIAASVVKVADDAAELQALADKFQV